MIDAALLNLWWFPSGYQQPVDGPGTMLGFSLMDGYGRWLGLQQSHCNRQASRLAFLSTKVIWTWGMKGRVHSIDLVPRIRRQYTKWWRRRFHHTDSERRDRGSAALSLSASVSRVIARVATRSRTPLRPSRRDLPSRSPSPDTVVHG